MPVGDEDHGDVPVSVWLCAPFQFSKPCRERCAARLARCDARRPRSGEHCVDAESLARGFAELGTGERRAVVGEADEALIEGGVPEGREQKAVVDVEALLVVAVGPGHDVGGAQQRGLGDAGERAAAAPVVHQASRNTSWPMRWITSRSASVVRGRSAVLALEAIERRVGQAHGELVDAVERGMELGHRLEDEGRDARDPERATPAVAPISATTPEWSIESSQGPRSEAPAIQIEPGAVVEA